MSIVIDGTLGVSAVQDGVVSESKIVSGAVTDTKLTLTPNSQEVKDALNATGSAPIYACRAWVNFDAKSGTPTIKASGNVSSITDNGIGDYTVNFTTAFSDAFYSVITSSDNQIANPYTITASNFRISAYERKDTWSPTDAIIGVSVFR